MKILTILFTACPLLICGATSKSYAEEPVTFEYTVVRSTSQEYSPAEICGRGTQPHGTPPFLVTLRISSDSPSVHPTVPVYYSTVTDPEGNFCFYIPYPDPNRVRGINYSFSGVGLIR